MRKLFIFAASALAALAMSACSFSAGGEGTFKYEGDDLEGVQTVYEIFFEETLNQTNMTVTIPLGSGNQFKEEIDGTSDFTDFGDGVKTYSFVSEGKYYYAYDDNGTKNYMIGEDYYKKGLSNWQNAIPLDLTEGKFPEDAVYYAKYEGTETFTDKPEDYKSNGTFELSITYGDGLFFIANGESQNGLVSNLTIEAKYIDTYDSEPVDGNLVAAFAYGKASLTNPDLTDWTDATPNE